MDKTKICIKVDLPAEKVKDSLRQLAVTELNGKTKPSGGSAVKINEDGSATVEFSM